MYTNICATLPTSHVISSTQALMHTIHHQGFMVINTHLYVTEQWYMWPNTPHIFAA